jgi:hypothetical protein
VKGFLVYDTRKSDFEKRNCMLVETADGIRVLRHGKLVKITAHVCCNCGEVKKYVEVTTEGVRDEVR